LLRIILGDFDFQSLEKASPFFGPLYFITYVFFVFFVLLNMFLAIINDTYSEVKSDPDAQKSEIELSAYFKKSYQKLKDKVLKKKDKMIDIRKALEMADINKDGNLTFDEWREELLKRGYNNSDIEAYFNKYDTNNDKCLSKDEMDEMRAKIQKEIDDCDVEMAKIKNKEDNINLEEQEEKEIEDFHKQLDT
jgi:polycystin 2